MLTPATTAGRAMAAVARLRAALGELAEIDPNDMAPAARLEVVEATVVADAQLTSVSSQFLTAANDADDTLDECGRTTRGFLVEELRCSTSDANRRMRLARRLPFAPLTAAALRAGEIYADHALLITGVLPRLEEWLRPTVEDALVELARTQPPQVVATAVDTIVARYAGDDAEAAAQRAYDRKYAERGFGLAATIGGTYSASGTLLPEIGSILRQALQLAGAKTGPDDRRSARQRHHDALGELARFYLAKGEISDCNGERPRIVVTMTLHDLLTRLCLDSLTPAGILDDGTSLTAATARRLACDSEVIPVVLGGRSEVLDLGRASRTWTTAQRRAAWARDQGRCNFPGCTQPPRELHHLQFWIEHHGRSDLANGAWLCTFHHWLVHEGRWSAHRDPDGSVLFTGPDGRHPRRHI